MVKVKLAKFQGPIAPLRYQEPAQIVQEVPLFNYHRQLAYAEQHGAMMEEALVRQLIADGYTVTRMHDEIIATECDADRREDAQKADAVRAYPHNPPDGCLDCLKAERNLTQVSSI